MDSQTFFRSVLTKRLLELKARNARNSLRAFARDLQQNPAALSQILRAKRRVSKDFALLMARRLGLAHSDLKALDDLFILETSGVSSRRQGAAADLAYGRRPLDQSVFDVISVWIHYAILSLAETKDFDARPDWIAGRFGFRRNAPRRRPTDCSSLA